MLVDAHTHLDGYDEAELAAALAKLRELGAAELQTIIADNWRRLVAGDSRLARWADW